VLTSTKEIVGKPRQGYISNTGDNRGFHNQADNLCPSDGGQMTTRKGESKTAQRKALSSGVVDYK